MRTKKNREKTDKFKITCKKENMYKKQKRLEKYKKIII